MAPTEEPLFPPTLVSANIADSLPSGYSLRPLARNDHAKGFFECLQTLTATGDISEDRFLERYDWMKTKGEGWFYCLVIEHEGRIVGTGVVIVERKFIHNLGTVGHIEDISISKEHQGRSLGLKLIQALDSVAVNVGCYKCILNCAPKNQGFYQKCGYSSAGMEMSHYFEEAKSDYERG